MSDLKHKGIINDGTVTTIREGNSARENGQILHDYLMKTSDEESLMKVCNISIAVDGNPKMSRLGKNMKSMLASKLRVHV